MSRPKSIEDIIMETLEEEFGKSSHTRRSIDEKIIDIADKNKKLFDAHVKAGFTEDQALQIIVAFINH